MIGMILAGGGGTRLWPYSRAMSPKQFLNLGGKEKSLLQGTFERIRPLVSTEDLYIIGSELHEFELKYQMSELNENNILLEPMGRNTAPAILWAILCIPEEKRNEPVVVLPADHLINDDDKFVNYLKQGAEIAKDGMIVTFGIKPDRPDTGYGYIKEGEPLEIGYKVARFVEKPDVKTAEKYLKEGGYSWNAGIFMGLPNTFIQEYKLHSPELYEQFISENIKPCEKQDASKIKKLYQKISPDSIDYAIMEKSKKTAVLPMDIDWNDLGSWESLHNVSSKDSTGNAIQGNVIAQNTENCLIFGNKKLVTCIGVKNLIIVDTDDALMVCDLYRSQDVKQLVETLKKQDRSQFKYHTKVLYTWGNSTTLFESSDLTINLMEIHPDSEIPEQTLNKGKKHCLVSDGLGDFVLDGKTSSLKVNESIGVSKKSVYSIKNTDKTTLRIIELHQDINS